MSHHSMCDMSMSHQSQPEKARSIVSSSSPGLSKMPVSMRTYSGDGRGVNADGGSTVRLVSPKSKVCPLMMYSTPLHSTPLHSTPLASFFWKVLCRATRCALFRATYLSSYFLPCLRTEWQVRNEKTLRKRTWSRSPERFVSPKNDETSGCQERRTEFGVFSSLLVRSGIALGIQEEEDLSSSPNHCFRLRVAF